MLYIEDMTKKNNTSVRENDVDRQENKKKKANG